MDLKHRNFKSFTLCLFEIQVCHQKFKLYFFIVKYQTIQKYANYCQKLKLHSLKRAFLQTSFNQYFFLSYKELLSYTALNFHISKNFEIF